VLSFCLHEMQCQDVAGSVSLLLVIKKTLLIPTHACTRLKQAENESVCMTQTTFTVRLYLMHC
jgi:hypothetical protein